ncbi:hypothetical protein D6V10_21200, partial [Vibrio cholerae]|nr:hypothetical protein [Vibrio cholerae]
PVCAAASTSPNSGPITGGNGVRAVMPPGHLASGILLRCLTRPSRDEHEALRDWFAERSTEPVRYTPGP